MKRLFFMTLLMLVVSTQMSFGQSQTGSSNPKSTVYGEVLELQQVKVNQGSWQRVWIKLHSLRPLSKEEKQGQVATASSEGILMKVKMTVTVQGFSSQNEKKPRSTQLEGLFPIIKAESLTLSGKAKTLALAQPSNSTQNQQIIGGDAKKRYTFEKELLLTLAKGQETSTLIQLVTQNQKGSSVKHLMRISDEPLFKQGSEQVFKLAESNDLEALSDGFTEGVLNGKWKSFDPYSNMVVKQHQKIDESNQWGYLEFNASKGGWFFDQIGPFLFQEVSSDFIVTGRLNVRGIQDRVPKYSWSMAGLLVRDEKVKSLENWSYLMYGTGDGKDFVVDEKHTYNNQSVYSYTAVSDTWITLAQCRVGEYIISAYRPDGGEWTLLKTTRRSDFGKTLQVGIANISDWQVSGSTDVTAYYDHMTFSRISPEVSYDKVLCLNGEIGKALTLKAIEDALVNQ